MMGFSKILAVIIGFILIIVCSVTFVLFSYSWQYGFNKLTTTMMQVPSSESAIGNISYATALTFQPIADALYQFKWISWLIIVAMFIGIIAVFFLVRINPLWSLAYLALIVVLIYAAIFMSRSYESIISENTEFSQGLNTWTGANHLIIFLPYYIGLIGILGSIPMFVNLFRDKEEDKYG